MLKIEDIKNLLKKKYDNKDFRINANGDKTIELQNIQFECDKPWILREPNYDYIKKELNWYLSMSRNVFDIEPPVPKVWQNVADSSGHINSNYGWCIFSKENNNQYDHCLEELCRDKSTRHAVMIYNRPSIWDEYSTDGRYDFICTFSTQCFLNEIKDKWHLKYIVYMRSNDAVFGFNNDYAWHNYVMTKLAQDLADRLIIDIICDNIIWNASSLHVYERFFKYLK